MIGEISIRFQVKGENAFFVSAAPDPGLLYSHCDHLINSGIATACISGWIELFGDHYDARLYIVENHAPNSPKTNSINIAHTPMNVSKLLSV